MADGDRGDDREQELTDALKVIIADDQPASDQASSGRIRLRMDELRSTLESKRGSSRFVDVAFNATERNRNVPMTLLAGALASRLVIYVIPFLAFMIGTTGFYSQAADVDPAEAAAAAGMPGLLADVVRDSTNATTTFRIAVLVGVLFATVWAADGLGKLLRRVHVIVWTTPMTRVRRRWAVPLVVMAWSLGFMAISSLGIQADDWPATLVLGELVTEFVAVSLAWLWIEHALPHKPEARSLKYLLPGALLVGLGIVGMKAAMVVYFAPRLLTLSARYGDIAWAIVLITWAYWIAFMLVLSAELNAALFKSLQHDHA